MIIHFLNLWLCSLDLAKEKKRVAIWGKIEWEQSNYRLSFPINFVYLFRQTFKHEKILAAQHTHTTSEQRCYNVILMFWRRIIHNVVLTSCAGCVPIIYLILSRDKPSSRSHYVCGRLDLKIVAGYEELSADAYSHQHN